MEDGIARFCFVVAMVGVSSLSMAQQQVSPAEVGNRALSQAPNLTSAQLSDLVAPIALYPDSLLSQVLVASTYPLEVVQAQQWLRRNDRLQGEELMDAARQQPWDASVQGLVAFPDALATLNRGHPVDDGPGQRFPRAGIGRHGRRAAVAGPGAGHGQALLDSAADGLRRGTGWADRHRDRTGRSAGDLRAAIRSCLRLGSPGVGRLSAALVRLWLRLRPGNRRRILVRRLGLGLGMGLGPELVRRVRLRQQRVLQPLRLQLWPPRRLQRRARRGPQRRQPGWPQRRPQGREPGRRRGWWTCRPGNLAARRGPPDGSPLLEQSRRRQIRSRLAGLTGRDDESQVLEPGRRSGDVDFFRDPGAVSGFSRRRDGPGVAVRDPSGGSRLSRRRDGPGVARRTRAGARALGRRDGPGVARREPNGSVGSPWWRGR